MSRSSRLLAYALLFAVLLPTAALACLWDYDTLKMERSRFPSVLELITGKFLRHSPEFYQWRIKDRLKRIEAGDSNPSLMDDLAVAYDKTGQHDKAIEVALKTEEIHPGRYETAANLGTFYFHSGKLREGLPHIERALKLNPDAHFGREKYQKLLVEYVLKQRKDGPLTLPLFKNSPSVKKTRLNPLSHDGEELFSDYLIFIGDVERGDYAGYAKAAKGILGMMKFGKHDSPVLLEALGSLLSVYPSSPKFDAKLLASRAYLKASYDSSTEQARESYREKAKSALLMQLENPARGTKEISLETVETEFKQELDEAKTWYEELREKELTWIQEGKNPEAEFDALYDADPLVSGMDTPDPSTRNWLLFGGGVAAVVILGLLAGVWFLRVRRRYRLVQVLASQERE